MIGKVTKESIRELDKACRRLTGRLQESDGYRRSAEVFIVFELSGIPEADGGVEAGHVARLVKSMSRSLELARRRRGGGS